MAKQEEQSRRDIEREDLAASPERVGVVVAGAGARGAYEAGALSVLLPKLEAAGARPKVFVGASAGAINATVLAANAHLPAEAAAAALEKTWLDTRRSDVFRSLLISGPRTLARYGAELLGLPWPRLIGLLDTSPQQRLADRALEWEQLKRNVDDGLVEALAVVATSVGAGRTTVFVHRAKSVTLPDTDPFRALDYVDATIEPAHVLASSAIPVAFPAVEVERPEAAKGWYTDGGVRLNTPIKPALALGVNKVVVVATHPATYPPADDRQPGRPEVDGMAVQVAEAVVVDRMVEDLRRLGTVNALVAEEGKRTHTGRTYNRVRYLFAGPDRREDLGELAKAEYEKHYGGWGKLNLLRQPDIPLLRRLVTDTGGPRQGDLLSYIYFQSEFIEEALARGKQDAEKLWDQHQEQHDGALQSQRSLQLAATAPASSDIPWQLYPEVGRQRSACSGPRP